MADRELPVRGVYLYLKALETANALDAFLEECDQKQLTLGVSDVLFDVGHTHYSALVHIDAVDRDCPACPEPPRL